MSHSAAVVVIGTSLGGLAALRVLLAKVPRNYPVPVVIAQHRVKASDEMLVRLLGAGTALPVREPDDKDLIEPGVVWVAPSDYHLLIEGGRFALSTDAPVNYARPSIDVLFESAAECYGPGALGLLLTGANDDGARGCDRIKKSGGSVWVQDPAEAESAAMPAAAIAATKVDRIMRLAQLADALLEVSAPVQRQ
jgi:two-component system chemotaxis response regulator CheB